MFEIRNIKTDEILVDNLTYEELECIYYEAYDCNGKFICSGDSRSEVLKEVEANET